MGGERNISTPKKHSRESGLPVVTTQKLSMTRTVDAVLAAGGAAGSLALLQAIQDNLGANNIIDPAVTPIVGGFLGGTAIKFFLNRNPPGLDAFWKSTAASILIGCSVHSFLWTSNEEGEATTIMSNAYSKYLIQFFMVLFWKLNAGSIWGAGNSLAAYIAFQSGFWGKNASINGELRSLVEDFPIWYILRPYLLGHFYLYVCSLGVAKIRQSVRVYLLRMEFVSTQTRENEALLKEFQNDRQKLRSVFDRIDLNADGRLDSMEVMLALRASLGKEISLAEISLEDSRYMIGSADSDGDGMLDFDEFCQSVQEILLK